MATSSSSEGSKEEVQTLAQNPSSEDEEPKPETEAETKVENPTLAQNPSSESSSEEDDEDEEDPEPETEPETKAEAETPKWRSRRKNPQTPTQSSSKTVSKPKNRISNKLSYSFQFQDETKTGFTISDLVWGKVRSHPWWPGQIFDPSEASSLASKHRRKNCLLVAYFGDKTFGWIESSVLKPFQKNFSRMEKQSKSEAFTTAVEASLAQVSRRVGAAFTCSCFENKEFSEVKIDNTGIKSYTYSPSGDVLFIRNSFDPVEFVGFVTDLGRNPNCETERLDLGIVKSPLKAFDRFRGCKLDPPEFNLSFVNFEEEDELNVPVSALMSRKRKPKPVIENLVVQKPVIENPVVQKSVIEKPVGEKPGNEEKVIEEPIIEKPVSEKSVNETEIIEEPIIEKTVIGNPVIEKPVNGKPVNEKEVTENPVTENTVTEKPVTEKKIRPVGRRKRKMSEILNKNEDVKTPKTVRKVKVGGPTGSTNSGKNKKKSLDSLGDLQKRTKTKKKFSNVDELLKCTTPKTENVKSSSKRRKSLLSNVDNNEKKEVAKKSEKKGGRKKKEREGEFGLEEYSSSSEMLSQLCLTGRDPLRSYSFGSMISSFFTGFRGFVVDSVEEKLSEKKKSESQIKRKKKDEKVREGNSVNSDEEKMSGQKKKRETQSQAKRKKKMNEEGILVISDEGKPSSKRKERGTQSQSKGKKKEEVNKEGNSVISDEEKPSSKQKKKETQSEAKRKKEQEGNSVISNEEKPSDKKKKNESESQTKRRRRNTKEKEETNLKGNSVISSSEKPTRQKKKQPESKSTTQKKKKQEPNLDGNSVISNNKSSEGDSVISAIVLNFNDPNAVPSETELNKFFTRFGPLHEDETVILKESSRAEVVFKNRADAELAFDRAGKFDVFGKGLVSFRLSFVKRL